MKQITIQQFRQH